RGEMGRCALVTSLEDGWLCGTGSIRVRSNKNLVSPSYLSNVLSTMGVRDWLLLESVGATMENLNTGILARIPLPLPPMNEQLAVNEFILDVTAKTDSIKANTYKQIEKLSEYRTALITMAVTGKIDVRSFQHHNGQEPLQA